MIGNNQSESNSNRRPGRFLKMREVAAETSLHRATIYRRIERGEFPRPHPIGGGRVVWLESEIEEWKARTLTASH